MRITALGVRGSTPAPGIEFVRYGGNTSCVAIGPEGSPPTLVLDAGTGLRRLPELLGQAAFAGSILLGHLHWDHTQGLPFCPAVDRADARVDLYLPEQGDEARSVLSRAMAPPHFPIAPSDLAGTWSFSGLDAGEHRIEQFTVLALDIPHKGGRTLGFRVSDATSAVAYLSDHQPTALGAGEDGIGAYHEAAMRLADGVDLLIHDAQYTPDEFRTRQDWGHATMDYPVRLAERAGAQRVWLFHHAPDRTDDDLDALLKSARADTPVEVAAAAEGMAVTLP